MQTSEFVAIGQKGDVNGPDKYRSDGSADCRHDGSVSRDSMRHSMMLLKEELVVWSLISCGVCPQVSRWMQLTRVSCKRL